MSFKLKTIVGIAVIEAILLFSLIWNSLNFLKTSNQEELVRHAGTTIKLLATMTKDAVLSTDLDTLESFIREILKNRGIVYARIISRSDGILAKGGSKEALKRSFVPDTSVDNVTDNVFDISSPISEGGISYGSVEVGLDVNQIQIVQAKARKNAVILAGIEMFLTALFSYFLGLYLTRQLKGLSDASYRIAKGELGYQIKIKGNDELAQAAKMFNKMSIDLKQTYSHLNQYLEDSRMTSRKLAESEARMRAILEQAVDGIITIDTKGIIESFNPAAEKIFGYSAKEMIGKNVNCLMPEPTRSSHMGFINSYLKNGIASVIGTGREVVGQNKNGADIPLDLAVSEIKLNDCHLFTGMIRDISKAKKAAAELKKYQNQLEQMVVERTQKLEKAQAELVTNAMESARAQLSAMVLHNIGNAITPTSVQLEKLKSGEGSQIIDYLKKCYQDLEAHAEDMTAYMANGERGHQVFVTMGELIGSLSNYEFSRIDMLQKIEKSLFYVTDTLVLQQAYASNTKEMKELTDLNALIEDALRMQLGALEKRDILIIKKFHENLPKLLIAKNRLMQVLVNIIKNSYEAIDALEEQPEQKTICITSFLRDGTIGFELKDNGIGLTSHQAANIFELGQSHKGSSGIGLYYCKMFINSNNGQLTLTSPGKGKGATLNVSFKIPG
ncbi:MAG: PAS domain S-box protein [Desulfobacteraceae bacterium]|jgi:PAS domain S-box-containing protein